MAIFNSYFDITRGYEVKLGELCEFSWVFFQLPLAADLLFTHATWREVTISPFQISTLFLKVRPPNTIAGVPNTRCPLQRQNFKPQVLLSHPCEFDAPCKISMAPQGWHAQKCDRLFARGRNSENPHYLPISPTLTYSYCKFLVT